MHVNQRHARALLTVAEMARADQAALAQGIAGERLMEAAGRAVADAVRARMPRGTALVLCGPGNNGGDGFVAARCLREAGWPVRLALLGDKAQLKGDAALNAGRWGDAIEPLGVEGLAGVAVAVDALFGAGLARPLEGAARAVVEAMEARGIPVVAVDVPSGLHGDTGEVLGAAPRAAVTVTFFRMKPGHLLLPGRLFCGETLVADIGIPATVLAAINPGTFVNDPALWLQHYPWPTLRDHKYRRGHALVVGGARMTGAGRLAARAALRAGAGLVTVTSSACRRADLSSGHGRSLDRAASRDLASFKRVLESRRKTVYLLALATRRRRKRARACWRRCQPAGRACLMPTRSAALRESQRLVFCDQGPLHHDPARGRVCARLCRVRRQADPSPARRQREAVRWCFSRAAIR